MTFPASQKGLSWVGWLLTLGLVAFAVSTALKIVPHYLDYMAMTKIIKAVETNKGLDITTVNEFYSYVEKSMQLNSIRDIDLNKALKVTVENNAFNAHLNYEQREPLIQNIDVVIRFDKQLSVGRP
ncbi:DUF4845 domain-containing protein [Pseudomonas alliivorans]|uniref:DUF4845 domain-containing protein n=1 Tax=Pseudomonas alliivorans TaxID=2810613 RepID=A0ABS4CAP0_9PSED|nr:DUF4845 domain-containing protein [Pseudomonas alliivorans]MBP0941167.1 DUF4845 domain-containing protein [Pseudomonas alliivorans]MBP0947651.1 DUF4845 domain-containing protein [Pseudomonas alliivorans]MBP0953656.1 DUF4845 domain-containing protein [Pseudomonas alliivorans]MCO5365590.1 DUF4845 domain-containing protein [Pseudomonas alliivorans]MEE4328190.1 DUF4845 domain-containing protein [Pseudomonas alliivorans]